VAAVARQDESSPAKSGREPACVDTDDAVVAVVAAVRAVGEEVVVVRDAIG
jgi:hypothetical protein